MSFTHYHKHQYPSSLIISPPITPKQQFEYMYQQQDEWDSTSTEGSVSSRSSATFSNSSAYSPPQKKMSISHIINPVTHRRQKQKPIQSLPSSTQGSFCMPTKLLGTEEITRLPSFSCAPALPSKRSSHRQRQLSPLVEVRKRKLSVEQAVAEKDIVGDNSPNAILEEEERNKKAKTSAAYLYDNLSADCDQAILFMNKEEWIPNLDVFNRRPMVRISWRGSPLKIKSMPYYDKLHAGEASIAATLRLSPEQYLKCKWALVLAAQEAHATNSLFRKSEAQKACCIDVNKTSVLWNAFGKLGWLGPKWPQ